MFPFLTSIRMSRFWGSGSWFFFFPVRAFHFSRKNVAPECSRNDDSCLPRPTESPVLLAWSGAQPCGARRAERLGRSGGPGQSRPRHMAVIEEDTIIEVQATSTDRTSFG